jgi:hypothetical protein
MTAIVQINFAIDKPEDYRKAALAAVPKFTDMDGLIWKVWLIDEQRRQGGGIYLFASRELAEAYAAGDIVADLLQRRPGTEVRVFDDLREASALTGAAFG